VGVGSAIVFIIAGNIWSKWKNGGMPER